MSKKGSVLGAHKLYEVDYKKGTIKRVNKFCPRCQGAFCGTHSKKGQVNRIACGSCGYTEFK
ncbi:MAG: 30S ribosomal protein S27ae [Candidatus Hodarchaeales archaeon]